jgi:WD40 repeat protein
MGRRWIWRRWDETVPLLQRDVNQEGFTMLARLPGLALFALVASALAQPTGGDQPVPGEGIARLGVARFCQFGPQYTQPLSAISLSRDGKSLATTTGHNSIQVWDTCTGALRHSIDIKGPWVSGLALAPDGGQLAYVFNDGVPMIGVIDVASGATQWTTPGGTFLFYRPDGKLLAANSRRQPAVFDPATGREIGAFGAANANQNCTRAALSHDGKTLATLHEVIEAGAHAEVKLHVSVWDLATGNELRKLAEKIKHGTHLSLSPDGKTLALGDTALAFIDVSTGKEIRRLKKEGASNYWGGTFSPEGKTFGVFEVLWMVEQDTRLKTNLLVLDMATGKDRSQFVGRQPNLFWLAFSPDGHWLTGAGQGCAATSWNVAPQAAMSRLDGHHGAVRQIFFSPDSKTLVSSDSLLDVRWWDLPKRQQMARLDLAGGTALDFFGDGKALAVPDTSGRISVDLATGHALRQWTTAAVCAALSPDGQTVAIVDADGDIVLRDVATKKIIRSMTMGSRLVRRVAFAADGRSFATCGDDWTVRWWGVSTGNERHSFVGHTAPVESLAFAPNGKILASGSADTSIVVWNLYAPQPSKRPARDLLADLLYDAGKFYAAMGGLLAAPKETLALIKEQLKPVPTVPVERINDRIIDLDSNKYAVRAEAMRDLETWQEQTHPHLVKAIESNPPLEVQLRVKTLLAKLDLARLQPSAKDVQVDLMLELLEHLDTPEARQHLELIASGAPDARLTRAAQAALARLK